MRRKLNSVISGGNASLNLSKRFARKRTFTPQIGNVMNNNGPSSSNLPSVSDSENISSLRTQGMNVAPARTSLDRIREQLKGMKEEQEHCRARQQLGSTHGSKEHGDAIGGFDSTLMKTLRDRYKPDDAFHSGKEIVDGISSSRYLKSRSLSNAADEVLRSKNKEEVKRYMSIAFPEVTGQGNYRREESVALARVLRDKIQEEITCKGIHVTSRRQLWLSVLDSLDDGEIQLMYESKLLDTDVLLDLLEGDDGLHEGTSDAVREKGEEEVGDELLLDKKLECIEQLEYLDDMVTSITDTTLRGIPSLDVAPAVVKALRRQYDDCTAADLRLLENYEEQESASATTVRGSHPASDGLRLTDRYLDRALIPANELLYAVSKHDEGLRRSLQVMERVKRESLLDPIFQEAVQTAHVREAQSVDAHLNGISTDTLQNSEPQRVKFGKFERRALRKKYFRGAMSRPAHAADVPYFFDRSRSVVPPRGNFNLPTPALTREERSAIRGLRRRSQGRTRFSR